MDKSLILTLGLPSWRLPFYIDMLKHGIKVFVLTNSDVEYNKALEYGLSPINYLSLGSFIWPKIPIDFENYNNIVAIFDLRLAPYIILKAPVDKVYFWGIGYGNNYFGGLVRKALAKKAKGIISYMPTNAIDSMYIINSIYNDSCFNMWSPSKSIVFIGGLNKRKRFDILIEAIHFCHCQGVKFNVDVIGDGPEKKDLVKLVRRYNLDKTFIFHGNIESPEKKEAIINNAFLSVSPGQAGLSILESFSYGLPFVTWKKAISGGEVLNITDRYNGYLLDNLCPIELANKLVYLSQNNEEVKRTSENAFNYYNSVANGNLMTSRFLSILSKGTHESETF